MMWFTKLKYSELQYNIPISCLALMPTSSLHTNEAGRPGDETENDEL